MRRSRIKFKIPSKYILTFLSLICAGLIILSLTNNDFGRPVKNAISTVLVPIQKGINQIGLWFTDKADNLKELASLKEENKELKDKIASLTLDNNISVQRDAELKRLYDLYDLDDVYSDYPKVAARVIAKDPGNWFSTFTIDKGTDDGLAIDMNVISQGGLVGIITSVGKNYSIIRAIIDDESSVSAKSAATSDFCFVHGDLTLMNDGIINVTNIKKDAGIKDGDMLLTSPISDKYLPGLLIGYIKDIDTESNNLTKSAYLTPEVDFSHLEEVLVITTLKNSGE